MRKIVVAYILAGLMVLWGCPQITPASPSLLSVQPDVITEGSADTELVVTGKNLTAPAYVVMVEGVNVPLATKFVSSTELTATVPAALLKTPGSAKIFALQGQNQTATQPLTIVIASNIIVPTLTGITPAHILSTGTSMTMTLTGTNFTASSVVDWNTTPLVTTFISSTQLSVNIAQSLFQITGPGVQKITVVNPGTTGGTSTAMNFTVVAPLAITTTSLPGGTIGTIYSAPLAVIGGTPPYAWTITSGTLPVGLSLNGSTGVISGTPSAAGSATFTVQVVDSTGALARRRF
jgi:hypothetical protein